MNYADNRDRKITNSMVYWNTRRQTRPDRHYKNALTVVLMLFGLVSFLAVVSVGA